MATTPAALFSRLQLAAALLGMYTVYSDIPHMPYHYTRV